MFLQFKAGLGLYIWSFIEDVIIIATVVVTVLTHVTLEL